MKSDFMLAITQLSAEKNLPKEVVLKTVEAALVSAYKKDRFSPDQKISVRINPATGGVKLWAEKTVVAEVMDTSYEISLDEARRLKPEVQVGEAVEIEATPRDAGRIAAQTAKQVILQRLHEAEHNAIFEEFTDREGDIVTGLVQHYEPSQIFINLGRTEAVLPVSEQVRTERYRVGQRLKVYLLEVARTSRGPRVIVSRSHPNLLRRLFELEVPEVLSGAVEIKAIAREAGYRSKIAVAARQEGIDPVGCCVGLRGIRIQNIVNELNGEKLDVVLWSTDLIKFIAHALSPAQVVNILLNEAGKIATVIVPDRQLSLAIGKEGQNARLAAKLSGWRIDIKSASAAEEERLATAKAAAEEEPPPEPTIELDLPEAVVEAAVDSDLTEEVTEAAETPKEGETVLIPPELPLEAAVATTGKTKLRFAEDIMSPPPAKAAPKTKKKKKKTWDKSRTEDGLRLKKRRSDSDIPLDEEEY